MTPTGGFIARLLARDHEGAWLLRDGFVEPFSAPIPSEVQIGDWVHVVPDAGTCSLWLRFDGPDFPPNDSDASRFLLRGTWSKLRARQKIIRRIRAFFEETSFLEVETPLLVTSPGTEVQIDAVEALLATSPDGPRDRRFLITSPELHMKRLIAAGAGPIFQFSRVFRDGELGAHHRPEFTMLEWYRPFAPYERLMEDCENLMRQAAGGQTLTYQGVDIDLSGSWPRLSFRDALIQHGNVNPDTLSPDEQLEVMVSTVEPALDPHRPVFITDFPIALASLARPRPDNSAVAERFELFMGGLELANAFGELTDAAEQRRRCQSEIDERAALGKRFQPMDEAFLDAMSAGLPPSSGIALGLDRLVMLLTDSASIDDVLAF